MAADPELVERLHALLSDEPSLEPKSMFGGVGFMIEGSLTVAAMGGGGLLARVGREAHRRAKRDASGTPQGDA